MSWPIGAVDKLPFKVTATLDGTILLGSAAVTESHGWVHVRLPAHYRGSLQALEVSVRLRLSVDAAARPFLFAEQVEFDGRRFAGMHAAAAVLGEHATAQISKLLMAKFTQFAIRRTDKQVSETRPAAREAPSLGADETWQPGARSPQRTG